MHSQSFNLVELAEHFNAYQSSRGIVFDVFGRFVDRKEELKKEFHRTKAIATGGALINFFDRKARANNLDLTILVSYDEYVKDIGHFFLYEGYTPVRIPINSTCYQEVRMSSSFNVCPCVPRQPLYETNY